MVQWHIFGLTLDRRLWDFPLLDNFLLSHFVSLLFLKLSLLPFQNLSQLVFCEIAVFSSVDSLFLCGNVCGLHGSFWLGYGFDDFGLAVILKHNYETWLTHGV